MKTKSLIALAAVAALTTSSAHAAIFGTATVTNADHYGYFGFASTSQYNTKATIGGFAGTARVIHVSGTITQVNPDAWVNSIQVQPSGTGIAGYQPWWEFSKQLAFTGTVNVSADIYAPGGFDGSKPLNLEMYSIDDEEFVPGLDARSTLTYSYDNSFAPGTASYSGLLNTRSPTFNRPTQYETIDGYGNPGYDPPEQTGAFPYYGVQAFHVDTAGTYSMVSASEFEAASVLYVGSFDPKNSLVNCVQAHDQTGNIIRNKSLSDLPYLDDAVGGTMITADLVPGVNYYFVTTAFNFPGIETDGGPFVGNYQNIITGAGNVTLGALVPEPTSLCAALAGLTVARRRRA